MVKVSEFFLLNKDIRILKDRRAWLQRRLDSTDTNAAGNGFVRAEASALGRILSQVEAKGTASNPPSKDDFDASAIRKAGWRVVYRGHSHPKPWTAAREFTVADLHGNSPYGSSPCTVTDSVEAESFGELEALVAAKGTL